MTKSKLIDMAKECGLVTHMDEVPAWIRFTHDQLAAFANKVIEMCADEIKHKVYAQDAECAIREMKVRE